jgi:hypothetical protein
MTISRRQPRANTFNVGTEELYDQSPFKQLKQFSEITERLFYSLLTK